MTPQGNIIFELNEMRNKKGELTDVAPRSAHIVSIPVAEHIDLTYALLMRYLPQDTSTRG